MNPKQRLGSSAVFNSAKLPCYFERTENKKRPSKAKQERAAGVAGVCALPVKSAVNKVESSIAAGVTHDHRAAQSGYFYTPTLF